MRGGATWSYTALTLFVLTGGCQAPAASVTPTAATGAASAIATSAAVTTPVQVGTGRAQVLATANDGFGRGNLSSSLELYERVINTPPDVSESPALSAAIAEFAEFRAMLALVLLGREQDAHEHLRALQERNVASPLARLGSHFWDQYSMSADARAACADVTPQVATQAGPTLATLREAGVSIEPDAVCSVPR